MIKKEQIVNDLLKWYEQNKRTLPWRQEPTPYHVWVSEIMLQQTRVEAVKSYYERFLQTLPTIADLANASEETLLTLWEGLGYYNRVRNMQQAARTIMQQMQGEFPDCYEQIITLKGIGEYTAGAIASIAFHEAVPAVDGNVLRVFSRLVGSREDILKMATKRYITEEIQAIMPLDVPGQFNQALMDLGAMVCIPNGAPHWQHYCVAKQQQLTDIIPVKQKKNKVRKETKTVFLLIAEGKIALTKRASKGLLAGMWQFPMADQMLSIKESKEYVESLWQEQEKTSYELKATSAAKHLFSHIEWQMKGRIVTLEKIPDKQCLKEQELVWVTWEELEQSYAIPSAFAKYREILQKLPKS